MSDSKETPKTPEELQKELQSFFKDRFGDAVFTMPMNTGFTQSESAEKKEGAPEPDESEGPPEAVLNFNMTPIEIKDVIAYLASLRRK